MKHIVMLFLAASGCAGGTRPQPVDLSSAPAGDLLGRMDLVASKVDLLAPSPARVVINELDPNGPDPASAPDWIELENIGGSTADLSGYLVRDSITTDLVPLPAGTMLAAGGFLILLCDDQPVSASAGVIHLPFKLNGSKGDEVHLRDPGDKKVDATSWKAGEVPDGKSWARRPDGTGDFAVSKPTRGAANE